MINRYAEIVLLVLRVFFVRSNTSESLPARYKDQNGFVVVPSFLFTGKFAEVQATVTQLRKKLKVEQGSLAVGRIGCHIPSEMGKSEILYLTVL
jgi:hypothetical protein